MNISRQRSKTSNKSSTGVIERVNLAKEDFLDDSDDLDMIHAADDVTFRDVEEFNGSPPRRGHQGTPKNRISIQNLKPETTHSWEPTPLGNGRWACNHKCKDKTKSESIQTGGRGMLLTRL